MPPSECPAVPLDDTARASDSFMSAFPSTIPHVIVVVKMPDPEEIIRTMQTCVTAAGRSGDPLQPQQGDAADPPGAPWLETSETSHFDNSDIMTQDALRNAENAGDVYSMASIQTDAVNLSDIYPALQAEEREFSRCKSIAREMSGAEHDQGVQAAIPEMPPPPIAVSKPRKDEKNHDMVPLPLLLIRRSDGVGFGTGRSVEAERLGNEEDLGMGSTRWGESRNLSLGCNI